MAHGRAAQYLTRTLGAPPHTHARHTTHAAFAPFSLPGVNTTLAKGIYFAIHAVGCFFICWKLKALGILPITSADWVQLIPARRFTDFSSS